MTTDNRQVRLLFNKRLSQYGIDNLELEIGLCIDAKLYFDARLKTRNKELARRQVLETSDLRRVEETWKFIMRMEKAPWESNKKEWQSFPRWLMEQDQKGKTVARFCEWFMSDDFRAKTKTMYTPDGRKTDGAYSFKAIYNEAFIEPEEEQKPDESGGIYV